MFYGRLYEPGSWCSLIEQHDGRSIPNACGTPPLEARIESVAELSQCGGKHVSKQRCAAMAVSDHVRR